MTKIGLKPLVSRSADRLIGALAPCSRFGAPGHVQSRANQSPNWTTTHSYTVLDKMFRSQVKLQTKLGLQVVQFDSFQFNVFFCFFLLKAERASTFELFKAPKLHVSRCFGSHVSVSEFFGRLDMNGKRSRSTTMWRFQARHLGMVLA